MDLSAPLGHSVNDGIDRELCTFHYTSISDAATCLCTLGNRALLAKMDIKQAYRNIPVSPDDRYLLGISWENMVYVDQVLPFGLRSAPLIFSAVADALLWIMQKRGVTWAIHYIDDFLTLGAPDSSECFRNMQLMEETCARAGLPIEPSKSVGPATSIVFLGIKLDSVSGTLSLPEDKLLKIKESLAKWRGFKACRKRDLLSLIGVLSHASKVVRASRIFLRRLIDLSTTARRLDHFIRLNEDARSDLEWWAQFVSSWNGVSLLSSVSNQPPDLTVTSDASGSWGCGAFWDINWFQLEWAGLLREAHIAIKELVPIVIATAIWGSQWRGKVIRVLSDNAAVITAINKNTTRLRESAHLLRCLAFICASFQCQLRAAHIPGPHNTSADALSRNKLMLFHSLNPQARPVPTPIPPELIHLLIIDIPDWTSRRWTTLWTSIFLAD